MSRPGGMRGLRHVALTVVSLEACERFYSELLGMQVEWRPDSDNVYLTCGTDNLALHRAPTDKRPTGAQRLDHIGFILAAPDAVDTWYAFLGEHQVKMRSAPRTHRDGARSFYCEDPDGNVVQLIYHPPLAAG